MMDRKRIFFVCTWYPNKQRPGEGIFLKNMAEAIAPYDDITVFYTCEDEHLTASRRELRSSTNGVDTIQIYHKAIRTGSRPLDIILNAVKEFFLLARVIHREFVLTRPDVFHLNVVSLHIFSLWYYKFIHSIPFVYSEHWDVPMRKRYGLIKRWLRWRIGMKLCSLFASKVIVCSEAMKEAFHYYGLSRNVSIISNVVEVSETDYEDDLRLADKKVLLHISSLDTAQKNVYGIIAAIAIMAKSRHDFELHILGKGKELAALKEYAAKKKLLDKAIFFHGYVSDEEKIQWIKRSIAHVIFSNFEGQSVVTAESLRYGRPVIATRCGGPEDFVNETNGLLIPPRDVDALAGAISTMLNSYQHFSPAQIRHDSAEIFSAIVIGKKHHELYGSILTGR